MIRETATLDHTGHLLYKATLSRLEDVADLPNTKKQREAVKIRRQKYVPHKRTGENSRKQK